MTATTIDTLELAYELRAGGVEEKPAAAIAQAIKRGVESIPVPAEVAQIKRENADIKTRLGRMENDIVEVKADIAGMKADIAGMKVDIVEMKERQARLETNQNWLKWAAGIIIALVISDIIMQVL